VSSGFQTAGKIRGRLKTHVERKKREPFVRKKRDRLGYKRTVSSGFQTAGKIRGRLKTHV
jgi:hypothetical protein